MQRFIITVCLTILASSGWGAVSVTLERSPGKMPQSTGFGTWTPPLTVSWTGLPAGQFHLKVLLLEPENHWCANDAWCGPTFPIDNADGSRTEDTINLVETTDVFGYDDFYWVVQILDDSMTELARHRVDVAATTNRHPTLSVIADRTVQVGEPIVFHLSATDPDGDGLSYDVEDLPPGAQFDPESQRFLWIPEAAGSWTVLATATDDGEGALVDAEAVTLTVSVDPPPGAESTFVDERVIGGLRFPTDILFADNGDLWIAEKAGTVRIVRDGKMVPEAVIDLSDEVNDIYDRGLLGIALDPDFVSEPWLYMMYSVEPDPNEPDSTKATFGRVVRYRIVDDRADPASRQVLIGADAASGIPNCQDSHTGGAIGFLSDGSLFITTGDSSNATMVDLGGDTACAQVYGEEEDIGARRSQRLASLCGKVLRMDPDTGLGLSDNPFFDGDAASNQSRVWAFGFRNPFRAMPIPADSSSEPRLMIADVGWATWEEMHAAGAGDNGGWPVYEGPAEQEAYLVDPDVQADRDAIDPDQLATPFYSYHHDFPNQTRDTNGDLAFLGKCVTGMAVYDGTSFPERYHGALFFADYDQNWIKVMWTSDGSGTPSTGAQYHLDTIDRVEAFSGPDSIDSVRLYETPDPVDLAVDPESGDLLYLSILRGQVRAIGYRTRLRPMALASASILSGQAPLTVRLQADGSDHPGGQELSYYWLFEDGSVVEDPNPERVYDTPGTYTPRLIVVAEDGAASAAAVTITVGVDPVPSILIIDPVDGYRFEIEEEVAVSAEHSGAESVRLQQDLLHNNHVHPRWAEVDTDTALFHMAPHGDERISFAISAFATSQEGLEASDRILLLPATLDNEPPVPELVLSSAGSRSPVLVHCDASGSSDPENDLLEFSWDFGDGLTGTGERTTHLYQEPGTYDVLLSVTDIYGATTSVQRQLVIPELLALHDYGFELSSGAGMPPDSGEWQTGWLGAGAAVVTATTARSGEQGLRLVTGKSEIDWFSWVQQSLPVEPGRRYRAGAWMRAVPAVPSWPAGGQAGVVMQFLAADSAVISTHPAWDLASSADAWQAIQTPAVVAPDSASFVLLICRVHKDSGATGQVSIDVDDTWIGVDDPSSHYRTVRVRVADTDGFLPDIGALIDGIGATSESGSWVRHGLDSSRRQVVEFIVDDELSPTPGEAIGRHDSAPR